MLSFLLAENKKISNSLQFCNSINGVHLKLRQLFQKLHKCFFVILKEFGVYSWSDLNFEMSR